jgi:Fe-S oxidoreductase
VAASAQPSWAARRPRAPAGPGSPRYAVALVFGSESAYIPGAMNPIAMTLALLLAGGFFAWTAHRRWGQLVVGRPEPRFSLAGGELWDRLLDVGIYALGQKKMPRGRYTVAGLAHIAIFAAFMVLGLNSVLLWARGYDPDFDFWGLLAHGTPLGDGYALARDLVSVAAIGGTLVFFYYRVVARSQRMTLGSEGLVILGIIATMMLADLTYNGARLARAAHIAGEPLRMSPVEPFSSLVGMLLRGTSYGMVRFFEHLGFWWHAMWVLAFGNMLPYSKHFHIITSFPNVFTRVREPRGALPRVDDLEGKVEREEPVGFKTILDLSWKDKLDLYTCTECGRCSDNCPAYTTGKKLSPKHLTLALRDHLYAAERALLGESPDIADAPTKAIGPGADGKRRELATNPPAPKDGYFQESRVVDLVPNVLHPDVIWACTTCRACEEHCPVMISYVDKIVQMRREEVMVKNEFPAELMKPFNAMETNGNPWNLSRMQRADWAAGLDIPTVADAPDFDVLYWVGCAASYDDRAKRVARDVARLMRHAGVKFAILGTEESCTGDPARRAGNEYLFQILAQGNIETLNGYGVDEKVIVTACPHCFNTLLNEYPQLGGRYEVVHHTDFLNGLVARGKLVPSKPVEAKVAYHDSCYLGRYNDVYESPRAILSRIPGVQLVEVPYWNRSRGLCCGAGGAQMWMEEQNEHRVNRKRTLQLLDTGATKLASACPFCMTMVTDGIKAEDKEESIENLDVAELLARSVDFDARPAAQAAE